MTRPLVAVVLAGGTGSRLYPASNPDRPKQFRTFGAEQSLLQSTVGRAQFADETYVLTSDRHTETVRSQVPKAGVLVEPDTKDTGPALVYAAHRLRNQLGDCVLLCLPSDHHIAGSLTAPAERAAAGAIETGGLVTIGVEPSRPATGYGYVLPGATVEGPTHVETFVEKPARERAQELIDAGAYWNTGMFAWTPDALLSAARQSPLADFVDALEDDASQAFETVSAISIDHAILESAASVFLVPARFEWDDLGTWDAIGRVRDSDGAGNVWLTEGLEIDSSNCVIAGEGHVSLVGVEDLVVARYGDRMLVVPREECERVREVVERLPDSVRTE